MIEYDISPYLYVYSVRRSRTVTNLITVFGCSLEVPVYTS